MVCSAYGKHNRLNLILTNCRAFAEYTYCFVNYGTRENTLIFSKNILENFLNPNY